MSRSDIHADGDAENGDTRAIVEESGLGVDIVRERYGLVKYDNSGPTRYYDWYKDESETFHLRVDELKALLQQIEDIDLERLEDSLEQLSELDQALGGSGI